MQHAIELARLGEGLTRPNPPVGAVIVKNDRQTGEGYHRQAGGDHAEIIAMRNAGSQAQKATIYVTLEPCSTTGMTPPCTKAIIESGIKRVVVAIKDPNPKHEGRGLELLRSHGVEVIEGVCKEDAENIIQPFAKHMIKGLPFVTLKLAMTADGYIADRYRKSQWISGPEARAFTHDLRRRADAIMVGRGTVEMDNPSLMPRPARGRRPQRVVVDSMASMPRNAQVLNDSYRRNTIIGVTRRAPRNRVEMLQAMGVTVARTAECEARVSLRSLMRLLARKGVLHVLCEGGGELAEGLIRHGLVDRYIFIIAPFILGGRKGVRSVDGKGWTLKNMPALIFESCEQIGNDIMINAIPGR